MSDMVDAKTTNEALAAIDGARVQVWSYTAGHGGMVIVLFRPEDNASLSLGAVACSSMRGPFAWRGSKLRVRKEGADTVVEDVAAGFELRCNVVSPIPDDTRAPGPGG